MDMNFKIALPEIWMALFAMFALVSGAFRAEKAMKDSLLFALIAFVGCICILVITMPEKAVPGEVVTGLNGLYIVDNFSHYMKFLVLGGGFVTIIMSADYLEKEQIKYFEFPLLIMFACIGMMIMISAANLLTLYVGLELQSLSLYVLASIKKENSLSSEAGLKYFVLGALSSAFLLYGISLIYGFTGTTSYETLRDVLYNLNGGTKFIGVIFGVTMIMAGIGFKISAAPFHMWTPDVYEGSPTPVTTFFATAPKIAAMALLMRFSIYAFDQMTMELRQLFVFLAVLSLAIGAYGAIAQTNIKRLMAYSSIGHMGVVLVGLASFSAEGVAAAIFYLTIYIVMTIGAFAVILSMRKDGRMVTNIDSLKGLSKSHPKMAAAMAVFMFSMAGIPPFAGFFGKFYVFMAAVDVLPYLVIFGVLASVVSAYYYLRIIKIMYFDDIEDRLDDMVVNDLGFVMGVSSFVIFLFFILPSPLLHFAETAANSIIPHIGG